MKTITVTGMVLSAMPVGETDRRLVLLTKEQGRITVFARGACRPKSTLTAVSRPFVSGEFSLYPRRDSYSLRSAEVREYFDGLSRDYDKTAYGCYFAELAGYFSAENADGTDLLNLLFLTLRALEKEAVPRPLIRLVFEYRLFAINGEYPQIFECGRCRRPLTDGYFLMASRRAVCPACQEAGEGEYLSASVIYTLRYIREAPVGRLYRFRVTQEVFQTLSFLLERWKKRYFDREFKAYTLVRQLESGAPDGNFINNT